MKMGTIVVVVSHVADRWQRRAGSRTGVPAWHEWPLHQRGEGVHAEGCWDGERVVKEDG